MPAIELNSAQPDHRYNKERQSALLKLWLILTSNEQVVNRSTRIFDSTAEASKFADSHMNSPHPVYYVDLEKLTKSLQHLKPEEVTSVINLLKLDGVRDQMMTPLCSMFWAQGRKLLGYGHVGCNTIQTILDL